MNNQKAKILGKKTGPPEVQFVVGEIYRRMKTSSVQRFIFMLFRKEYEGGTFEIQKYAFFGVWKNTSKISCEADERMSLSTVPVPAWAEMPLREKEVSRLL